MQLYGRTLHPELFEVFGTRRVVRGMTEEEADAKPDADGARPPHGYEAVIQITSAGHVVTWRHGELTLTEVAASAHQPLPQRRRLMSHRLGAERSDRVACRGGVSYEVAFGIETATPEALQALQQEFELMSLQGAASLSDKPAGGGLLHRFEASGRTGLGIGAASYIDVQSRDRDLRVRAIHTFPDDHAIVKSESHFRLPD